MEANYFTILWWFLPYIHMNPPWVYMYSPSWTSLPPLSPSHPSGSSQCTSPKHPVSCIEPGLVIHFTYDNIHVSMLSLKSSHSHLLPHGPKVCSLHLCLFCAQHFLINQRVQSLQSGWYPLAPGASTHKDGLGRQEILFVVHSEILHNHPNFNWLINYSFS